MISTPSELTTFIQATFDGTLLSPDSITEMQKTVDTDHPELRDELTEKVKEALRNEGKPKDKRKKKAAKDEDEDED